MVLWRTAWDLHLSPIFFFKENISFVLNYKFLLVYLLCNTKDKIIQFNIPGSQWAHWV